MKLALNSLCSIAVCCLLSLSCHSSAATVPNSSTSDSPLVPASSLTVETMKQYIPNRSINVQTDLHANPKSEADQSRIFQDGIDQLASQGGGYLEVPAGEYYINGVCLASHVVVRLDKEAKIHQYIPEVAIAAQKVKMNSVEKLENKHKKNKKTRSKTKESKKKIRKYNLYTFLIGSKTDPNPVEYAGIWCEEGMAKGYIPAYDNGGIRFVLINHAKHFVVSGLEIFDHKTAFCTIMTGGVQPNPSTYIPVSDGYIGNIVSHNCHFGYGLVQTQGGRDIHFENLSSEGGVALRLETGATAISDDTAGTLFHITGRHIYCQNGDKAVMMSPHTNKNGIVQIEDVVAESCGFGVHIGLGFVNKKNAALYPGITVGTFAKGSYIRNVEVIHGNHAQIRNREIRCLILNEPSKVPQSYKEHYLPFSNSVFTEDVPSIAPVLYTAHDYEVELSNVTWKGFKYLKDLPFQRNKKNGEVDTPKKYW